MWRLWIRAHFRNNELVFLKLKILSVILERNKNDILERNKKTNDTISCPNIVEAAVEKWSSSNFANVHDFWDILPHPIYCPWLGFNWSCHFLLKQPEIWGNFIINGLFFFSMEIFCSLYFSILWGELCSKLVAVWQFYHYS